MTTPIPAEPDTERRTRYTGVSASTGPFNVGFDLYGDSTDYAQWVEVWVNSVKVTQSGNWTLDSPSGSLGTLARPITDARITFIAAQTGTIDIVGARRPRRTTQFTENRGVTARDQNQVITDLVMTIRERWDKDTRLVQTPPGDTIGGLPVAASRANLCFGFDGSGNPTMLPDPTGSATAAAASATAAAASASSASSSATSASSSASSASTSASGASTSATSAAASATTAAAQAAMLSGTSTTSLAIATGSKTFTTQASKSFAVGTWLLITSDADTTNYMHGQVTAYSGTTLTVNVTNIGGSGTKTDWTIAVSGTRGAAGATGATGATGPTGPTGPAGPGSGDMLAANNLSDLANKPTSRTNLGVAIGTDVQAFAAELGLVSTHGADVASASTINLETATGDIVDVTGTTAITAITLNNGHVRTVRFTGALTLTNGASLVLPSGANITTAAGDFAIFRGYASSVVRCVGYLPATQANMRTLLGLGSLATQSGTFSGTSSGTNTGDQTISDATITTTDITTNNVSTSKHGFVPKAPNDAAKFLDGTGAFSVPTGVGGITSLVYYTSTQTITIPAGATKAWIRLVGGGGGSSGTGVGSGAGYLEKYLSGLTPGGTLALTIGAAGTTGNGGDSVLASGTQSITTLTATKGVGGSSGNKAGGIPTNGDININGGDGVIVLIACVPGHIVGGSTPLGTGGMDGNDGKGFGSGGSQAGVGKIGVCIILWSP